MLKQSLVQNLEQDKEKFFKSGSSKEQQGSGDAQDRLSKNKKRKEKWHKKRGDDDQAEDGEVQNQEEEDEDTAKKRKRLALYGVQ